MELSCHGNDFIVEKIINEFIKRGVRLAYPGEFSYRAFQNKKIDLILSPAIGGIVIGYEIGKLLKREAIFCERVNKKFKLRRGFRIKPKSNVLIVEDVITTGKSSLECVKLIKKSKAKLVGYACIIDRSDNKKVPFNSVKLSLICGLFLLQNIPILYFNDSFLSSKFSCFILSISLSLLIL